jgi:hypothetical protein
MPAINRHKNLHYAFRLAASKFVIYCKERRNFVFNTISDLKDDKSKNYRITILFNFADAQETLNKERQELRLKRCAGIAGLEV